MIKRVGIFDRVRDSISRSTISVQNRKPPLIYDNVTGSYFAPLHWIRTPSITSEWIWLSSLDNSAQKVTLIVMPHGFVYRAFSYHSHQTQDKTLVLQRPALY